MQTKCVPHSEVCENNDIPQLLKLFLEVLNISELESELFTSWYRRIWTPGVTLWYLVWQRLRPDHTLEAVVLDARRGGVDSLCFPGEKPISQKIVSLATTAFVKARQRLSLAWVKKAFTRLAFQVEGLLESKDALPCRLIDGSTVRLRPHADVLKEFPKHRKKDCYWTTARVLVCFGAISGVALGALIGSSFISEQALAVQLLLGAADRAIYIGDSNFGIWRVVRAAVQKHNHVLVRLTRLRAKALAKAHKQKLRSGLDVSLRWSPTAHDQVDPGLKKEPVDGRLVVLRVHRNGFRVRLLCLFTTLTDAGECPPLRLLEMYGTRWQAELNLRSLKSKMNLAQLEVKSAELVHKEILAGLMACNLVRGLMVLGARQAGITPQQISFSLVQKLLSSAIGELWMTLMTPAKRYERVSLLLKMASKAKLPARRKTRPSEPRAFWRVPLTYAKMQVSRVASRKRLKTKGAKS